MPAQGGMGNWQMRKDAGNGLAWHLSLKFRELHEPEPCFEISAAEKILLSFCQPCVDGAMCYQAGCSTQY